MIMDLKQQEKDLKMAAKRRGLRVCKDKRLSKTPYIAMNPCAAKELGQPCVKNAITYSPRLTHNHKKRVMDIRHEIIEFDEMSKGKKYNKAHKIANRKQRTIWAVK